MQQAEEVLSATENTDARACRLERELQGYRAKLNRPRLAPDGTRKQVASLS